VREERILIGDKVKIYRRGKKRTWVADFWHNGKHCRKSLKTSNKKIATNKAIKLASELSSGEYQTVKSNILIEDAIESYLSSRKNDALTASSLAKYKNDLVSLMMFCKKNSVMCLHGITPALFEAFRTEQRESKSQTTLYTASKSCKSFLSWCEGQHLVRRNPLSFLKLRKPVIRQRPVPSVDDLRQILKMSNGLDRLMISVLAMTGIRGGDLMYLQTKDIDLIGNWIHVIPRDGERKKSRLGRKIPIHPMLGEILLTNRVKNNRWYFESPPSRKNPESGRTINRGKLNSLFQDLAKSIGLPVGRDRGGMTLHSLRRFFETYSVNSGIPQRAVDLWMDHTGDKSMGAYYYTLTDTESQCFMNKLNFSCLSILLKGDTYE